ncbi:MAG: metallopeptidase [Parcubacteria group bacterium Gr01-1014_20]|nr:MAG: metallopeptidase [Parcubacteria group bacterium Gr01-1014_20]
MKKAIVFAVLAGFLFGSTPWFLGMAEAQVLPNTTFSIDDRVQVVAAPNANLKVKEFPTATSADLGSQPNRSIGTVIAGPSNSGNVWYWNVDFDENPDGWVAESGISKLQPRFVKDDEVEVLSDTLRVRRQPSILSQVYEGLNRVDNVITTIYVGNKGKVLDGPFILGGKVIEEGPYYQDGYIWWKINWGRYCPNGITSCTDLIGWSAEAATDGTMWLAKVTLPSNTNVPPPSAGGDFTLSQPSGGATYQKGTNLPVSWGTLPVYQYYAPVGLTAKLAGPYNDSTTAPTERVIITKGSEVNPGNNSGGYTTGSSWMIASDVKDGLYVVKATADYSGNGSDRNSISGAFRISGTAPPGGNPTSTPTGEGSFSSPVGGESWAKGQTHRIGWNTPTAWNVSEVSLILVDANGNNLNSIAIVKDNIPVSIQGGGDFSWVIPTTIANGTYKIKATVNRRDTSSPNTILSNQFTIGDPVPGGDNNQPPVISRVDGPTSLNVGQGGTWTIVAIDATGDVLTYEATWGDGSATPAGTVAALTHTFTVAGTYSLMFRVKDAAGLSAQYPFTVTVTAQGGGGPIGVGDRVVVTANVNVRVEANGSYVLGTQYKDILYSGFRQFAPAKGVVIEAPQTVGGYTWVKVNYDYGPDGWSVMDYLSSIGHLTGEWAFTGDNILGRKIQPSQGSVFTEAYYYFVENGQVSIPSEPARNSLDAAGMAAATGGAWNCQAISDAPPFRWVGYRCKYGRGNQPPTIVSFNGSTSSFTNIPNTWRFQATDLEGALASYKVDWGDGSAVAPVAITGASVTQELSHAYAQVGSFNIKLTVTDGGGLSAESVLTTQVAAPCSTRFQIGDRVRVVNTSAEQDLRVRETPNGTILGNKANGAMGTIIGGPGATVGYCWWRIDYDGGPRGWSAEAGGGVYWLELVSGGNQSVGGAITIISPAAGDIWHPGEPITIRWTAPSSVTRVHIYLAGVGLLAQDEPNDGVYVWTVPQEFNGQILEGTSFAIAIYAGNVEAGGINSTSRTFTITTQGGSGGLNQAGGGGTVGGFARGCTVRTAANLNVRVSASTGATVVGTVPLGTEGLIVDGPVSANGYTWWRMDFPGNYDGWSVENFLLIVVCPPPPNQAPVLGVPTGVNTINVNTSGSWQVMALDADSPALAYNVNWGDGTSNTTYTGASGQAISISHTYTQSGTKTFTVTVSDGQLTDTESFSVSVVGAAGPNRPPVLDPFTTPNQATVNVNTTWQAKAVDPDGTALSYTFNWGDGTAASTFPNIASGQSVPAQHTFTQSGSRTITVTASDGQLSDTESLVVMVSSTVVNLPPVLTIAGPTQVYVFDSNSWQLSVRDTANSPNIPTVTITYNIDFGDGSSTTRTGIIGSSGVTTEGPIHTYKTPGDYVMTVTVSDGQLSTTQTYNIKVLALSVPVISSFTGPTTLPANILGTWQVTATASTTMTYSVDWGDGGPLLTGSIWLSGETKTFSHTYLTTGQKNISVTVRGQKVGQVTTQSKTVTVGAANGAPTVASLTGPTALGVGVQGNWVVTGADAEGGLLNYQVDWGDGNFSAYTGNSGVAVNITHTYKMDDPYTIRVTAVDSGALRASRSLAVNVSFPVKTACAARFTVNPVYPYGEDVVTTAGITVRSTASPTGSALVGMGAGTTGKALEGPVLGGGYCWYKIRYVTGNPPTVPPVGYTADNWLEKASLYAPAPTTLTITGSNSLTPNQQGSWRVKAVSTGYGPISYVVNWGDGVSNSYSGDSGVFVTPDPRHIYSQAGIKTIQVTATNARGGVKSIIFEVNVR